MRCILALALLIATFCAPAQAQSVGNANNFVVGAVPSGGCCTLVAHTTAHDPTGSPVSNVTTPAINTTGANLEIVTVTHYGASVPTITDSKSNTWTLIYDTNAASTDSVGIWYSFNPSVGASQTFTVSSAANYTVIMVTAFSGAASGYDSPNVNHNTSTSTSVTPGSVTPSGAPAVLVTAVETHNQSISSINSSFTITDNTAGSSGSWQGGATAYLLEASAAAKNPTWTVSGTNPSIAVQASFK